MATIRSTRFVDPYVPPDADSHVLYTVPLGRVALVKSVRVVNLTDDAHAFDMLVGPAPASGWLFAGATVGPRAILADGTWWVAEAEDELTFEADSGGVLSVMVSGALLGA